MSLSEYEPKLENIICLNCSGKIIKHRSATEKPYHYMCENGRVKKCISKSSGPVCEKLDKVLENEFEKIQKSLLQQYKNNLDDIKCNTNISELYQKRIAILKEYPDGYIIKDLEFELKDIEKQIYLLEWNMKYNNTEEFKFLNIIKYTNIQVDLTGNYGIIKFIKPPVSMKDHITNIGNVMELRWEDDLCPEIDIKFSWITKKGRKPQTKNK